MTREPDSAGATEAAPVERSRALRWFGRIGGPALALGVWFAFPAGLSSGGRAAAAIAVLMAVLWMTEAVPLPVTSLIPIGLFPLAGVATIEEATAPYANKVIFLFLGGFMLAIAMQRWGLHRRIALLTLLAAGTTPARIVGGFMVAAAVLSMWVSNTAAAIMLLPVGISVVRLAGNSAGEAPAPAGSPGSAFSTSLVLGIAYGSSIGSVATPIGTPPNLLMKGFVREAYGIDIGFAQWMAFGVPLAAAMLPLGWVLLTRVLFRLPADPLAGGREVIRRELAGLGPVSREEWTVSGIFMATASAWVLREPLTGWEFAVARVPGLAGLDDAGIAILAVLALFAVPVRLNQGVFVLDWESAKEVPWGLLLLFGGGLSLAAGIQRNGVDRWIGDRVEGLGHLPLLVVVTAVVALVILLTELTSNTATAATFLPILGAAAIGIGVSPLLLVVPATLAASFAFMLPVATPPNAVAFGSGEVSIARMVRAGIWFNLAGMVLILAVSFLVAAPVLGVR